MTWLDLWLQCNGCGKNLHLIIAMIIILLHVVDTLEAILKRNHTLNAQVSAMLLAWIFRLCDNGLGVLSRIQLGGSDPFSEDCSDYLGILRILSNVSTLENPSRASGKLENHAERNIVGLKTRLHHGKNWSIFTQKIPMVHLRPATSTRVGWPRFEKSVQKWYRMWSKMVPKSAPTLQESDSPRIRVKQATCKQSCFLLRHFLILVELAWLQGPDW